MISLSAITAWRSRKPWRTDLQVAQDLFLSTLAIEIAKDPVLGQALIWRGGTCFHQLHLPAPQRYSEDLDYVLLDGAATYRDLDAAFERIASTLGTKLQRDPERSSDRYKTWFLMPTAAGDIVVKVEINPRDARPALDLIHKPLSVKVVGWYDDSAQILTFETAELLGTKFRAIAQRRKGRDLWDLDQGRTTIGIDDDRLAAAAAHYLAHASISPATFRVRLAEHLTAPDFLSDMETLVVGGLGSYDAVQVGRRLTVWSDQWLDPRLPTHQQRQSGFPDDGLVQCPGFARSSGNWARCQQRVAPGSDCPSHSGVPTESW